MNAAEVSDELGMRLDDAEVDADTIALTVKTPAGTFRVTAVLGGPDDTEYVLECE